MAVREGFEPSNGLTRYTLSKRAPSATRTPHHITVIYARLTLFLSHAGIHLTRVETLALRAAVISFLRSVGKPPSQPLGHLTKNLCCII